MAEGRRQKTEDRGQRTDGRREMAAVRGGLKSEVGMQKSENIKVTAMNAVAGRHQTAKHLAQKIKNDISTLKGVILANLMGVHKGKILVRTKGRCYHAADFHNVAVVSRSDGTQS